jgi:hypothetical protein
MTADSHTPDTAALDASPTTDIETVRAALNPPFTTRRNGLAALDRIEARMLRYEKALIRIIRGEEEAPVGYSAPSDVARGALDA